MNKKFVIYSLVALLTGSTITALSIADSSKAQEQTQEQAPPSETTTPMPRSMEMTRDVDKPFIKMMIPHHQGANEMAEMALRRARNPEIKRLAQSIIDEQTREIQQMRTWYKQWYGSTVPNSSEIGSDGSLVHNIGKGMGMNQSDQQAMMQVMQQMEAMDREMMAALENASNFDQEFLRQMTRHHRMAMMMADMVVHSGQHPETRRLAHSIIRSQAEEIAQMQRLLNQTRN